MRPRTPRRPRPVHATVAHPDPECRPGRCLGLRVGTARLGRCTAWLGLMAAMACCMAAPPLPGSVWSSGFMRAIGLQAESWQPAFEDDEPSEALTPIVTLAHADDPEIVAKVSRGLGEAMVGINVADLPVHHRLEDRGW